MIPLKKHAKEYLWAFVMAASASYAHVQQNHVVAYFLAFGAGYCLNEGFHHTVAYYQREIDRIRAER